MKAINLLVLLTLLSLCSCGLRQGGASAGHDSSGEAAEPAAPRPFPLANVPMVYGDDPAAAQEYMMDHYWDAFLAGEGKCSPELILGVKKEEVEQALANYIALLEDYRSAATPDYMAPLERVRKSLRSLHGKLESRQLADTACRVYPQVTELVSKYLYDPNSPMRDEDLFLPFAESMAVSPCTSDNMRAACRYEAAQCGTNSFGTRVPDVKYCDKDGRKGNLHSVRAEYTMLFFSNPGCSSCKEIIDDVLSRDYINDYIAGHRLAIVNIYIDEDISAWRDYVHNYPRNWINGYDYSFKLRDSGLYDIRAIPSLYLLDSSKRVLLKDAPTERVLQYLDRI